MRPPYSIHSFTMEHRYHLFRFPASFPLIGRYFEKREAERLAINARQGDVSAIRSLIDLTKGTMGMDIRQIALDALSSLADPVSVDALCDNLMATDDETVQKVAQSCGYVPSDEEHRALFYIITGQWDAYETLDRKKGHPLLRGGYRHAAEMVRQRTRETLQQQGRIELLYQALTSDFSPRPDLSGAEWEWTVDALRTERRWIDLWSLLFRVSPPLAGRIFTILRDAEWNPPESDRALWKDLIQRSAVLAGFRPPVIPLWQRSHVQNTTCISVSPDGSLVATGNEDGAVVLWGLPEGEFIGEHRVFERKVTSLAFSTNGSCLSCGCETGAITLLHLPDVSPLFTVGEDHHPVTFLRFTQDGVYLVSGDGAGEIVNWDIRQFTRAGTCESTGIPLVGLEIVTTTEGNMGLARDRAGHLRLFRIPGGEPVLGALNRKKKVTSFAVNDKGSILVTGDSDHAVRTYSLPELVRSGILYGHERDITALTITEDDTILASGDAGGTICLWNLPEKKLIIRIRKHDSAIRHLQSLQNGLLLASTSDDSSVRFWRLPGGSPAGVLFYPANRMNNIALAPDGSVLITGKDEPGIHSSSLADTQQIRLLKTDPEKVVAMAVSPRNDLLAIAGSDRSVYVRELFDGHLVRIIKMDLGRPACLSFTPDGRYLAVGGDDQAITLWDVGLGEVKRVFRDSAGTISSIAISPDGTLVAGGGWDQNVYLWNLQEGSLEARMKGHQSAVTSLAFSPDGSLLASGSNDTTVGLWDPRTGKNVASLHGHRGVVTGIAFTPDGDILASTGWDKTIRLWDPKNGTLRAVLEGHTNRATGLDVSDLGTTIISGNREGTIRFWSLYDGKLTVSVKGHREEVTSLVAAGNNRFASAGAEGSVCVWSLPWVKPLGEVTPFDLQSLRERLQDPSLDTDSRRSVECLQVMLQGAIRNDIEIDSISSPTGEFDIEIALVEG